MLYLENMENNMANVYISFLGTSKYIPCIYYDKNGNQVQVERFVQQATITINCNDWNDQDRVLIFTTKEAYQKNWLDNGHNDGSEGLEKCLQNMNLQARVQQIDIPSGNNENEIWEIFSIVYGSINMEDAIIFDITHAFRSIPMLAIIILNYAKFMKNVSLKGIYYGAFEALGKNPKEALAMDISKRRIPIFDLTAFDNLLEWSSAVDQFVNAGNAKPIGLLAKKSANIVLKESKGKEQWARDIKSLGNHIEDFSLSLATCRCAEISNNVKRLNDNITRCINIEHIKPLQPVFHRVKSHLDQFDGSDVIIDGLNAAKWCLNHNLIQQSVTILLETLISFWLIKANQKLDDSQTRELVNKSITIKINDFHEKTWQVKPDQKPLVRNMIEILENNKELYKQHNRLNQMRNDINHCGTSEHTKKASDFEKVLNKIFDEIEGNNLLGTNINKKNGGLQ